MTVYALPVTVFKLYLLDFLVRNHFFFLYKKKWLFWVIADLEWGSGLNIDFSMFKRMAGWICGAWVC